MTPLQRQQLESLQQEQRRLVRSVEQLDQRLAAFLKEVENPTSETIATPVRVAPPPLPPPIAPPPPVNTWSPADEEQLIREIEARDHVPPPLPSKTPADGAAATQPPPIPAPREEVPDGDSALARGSLEMTLGTVWLARIGIVVLVTGLVFLGNYAWQHIVHALGPGGKLTLLCLAGGALLGLGTFLGRWKESLRTYAQVLLAGGAATLYYATYAAHFVRPLRVIESPAFGGLLLLAVSGVLLWWSDRRRLQAAALLAIALSYYTSAINPIGTFTLYSSVLLTCAAGFLLIRRGWALVSWISLAGTYGSFVFWRFHVEATTTGLRAAVPWSLELWLLASYWVIFTASVFLARADALPAARRATFVTLNNGLFFWLASQHLLATHASGYWGFALGFGLVLLALGALARHRSVEDYALDGAYLVQGLAAITAGLALKLTGPSLAVTLALESAILLSGARRRHGAIYQLGAGVVALWAFGLAFHEIGDSPEIILPLGSTISALLILDAWWLKQRLQRLVNLDWSWRAFGFAVLAFVLIGYTILLKVRSPWEPTALALVALVATASIYLLRLPEVVILGQVHLGLAVLLWSSPRDPEAAWWMPLPLLAITLGLAHWWQRQRIFFLPTTRDRLQFGSSAAFCLTGYFWLHFHTESPEGWMAASACAGLLTVLYGYALRLPSLLVVGQTFFLHAFVTRLLEPAPAGSGDLALLPLLGLAVGCLIFAAGDHRTWPQPLRGNAPWIAFGYWCLAFLLYVQWIFDYLPVPWQSLALVGTGGLLVLLEARYPSKVRLYTALVLFAIALLAFLAQVKTPALWQELLALILIPGTLRLSARLAGSRELLPRPLRNLAVGLATGAIWLWVTRWVQSHHLQNTLTLAWSALALAVFVAGLTLRDRVYRLAGFLILALALGRVFFVDVWQLETIYRILSFLGLGLALLALGFVYNRYADRIQKWL